MQTVYLHNGIVYLNKDLALLNGASNKDLIQYKLNETDSFDVKVNYQEVTIEDDYQNEIFLETNKDLEYFATVKDLSNLSNESRRIIENEIQYFIDEFDPSDFFNTND